MDAKQRMTAISCLILILLTSSCTPPVQKTLSPSEVPPTRIVLPTVPLSITPEPVGTPISIPVLNAPPLQLEVITEANAPYLTTLEDIRFRDDEWPDQAAFSSLGPYLIIVIKNAYGELPTAVVRARAIGTGEIVSQIEVPSNVLINPDGLHVTAYDQHVYVLEAIGGKVAADEQPSVSASQPGVWFSPDGTLLAIGDVAGLEVWDIQQNTRASILPGLGRITAAAFTQNNSRLAIIDSGNVSVYDTKTGERISEIPAAGADGEFSIRDAILSPDGAYLAIIGIASDAAGFQLWDVNNATRISNWNSEISGSKAGEMLFSPDGQWLAYSIFRYPIAINHVYLFDVKTGALQRTLAAESGLAFSPDGNFFAAATDAGVINLWDFKNDRFLVSLYGHMSQVYRIAFSQDGTILASISGDSTIRLWGFPSADEPGARAGVSVSDGVIWSDIYRGLNGLSRDIPSSWLATGTNPARHHIDLTYADSALGRECQYVWTNPISPGTTGNSSPRPVQIKKFDMTATIVDLEDFQTVAQQTFLGQYDEFLECPASWDFTASGDTYYVGALDEAEFTAWLYATMAPLGFTP